MTVRRRIRRVMTQTGWQTGDILRHKTDSMTFTQRHETDRMTDTRHVLRGMRQTR